MLVGVPKEIKECERRVAVTPSGAATLASEGHTVWVETRAGEGSGYSDEAYRAVGAQVVPTAAEAWSTDMVVKVKEPIEQEFGYFRDGLLLFTYLHLAAEPSLAKALRECGVTAIAYETLRSEDGSLPLLAPMSAIAGRMAPQVGAQCLESRHGGRGILLGGVPGVEAARVAIIGGGTVGQNAARIALGMGAQVTILESNPDRVCALDERFQGRVQVVMSSPNAVAAATEQADLVIGAVLIPGAKAPKLVTEAMVSTMAKGSVIVDVAVDQGGSIETIDRATTHAQPTYVKHGVIHYAVANMPGAVACTSTLALTNATLPYVLLLARTGGRDDALSANPMLASAVNTRGGHITCRAVAEALGPRYVPWWETRQAV